MRFRRTLLLVACITVGTSPMAGQSRRLTQAQTRQLRSDITSGRLNDVIDVTSRWVVANGDSAVVSDDDVIVAFILAHAASTSSADIETKWQYLRILVSNKSQRLLLDWFDELVQQAPANAFAEFFTGVAYAAAPVGPIAMTYERKFDRAIEALEKSVQLKPDFARAHYSLAEAYELSGMVAPKRMPVADAYRRAAASYDKAAQLYGAQGDTVRSRQVGERLSMLRKAMRH